MFRFSRQAKEREAIDRCRRRVKDLVAELQRAGFVDRGGKGSHRNFVHPNVAVYGGCHGPDEKQVFNELCEIVDEILELYRKDGRPLPSATSGRDFVNRMQDVA